MSTQSVAASQDAISQQLLGPIRSIGIIGAGTMGQGIAQVCAQAGFDVVLQDIAGAALEKARHGVANQLDRQIKKQTLDEAGKAQILARVRTATELEALAQADVIIEAATEQEGLKRSILKSIDAMAKPQAILASNTSSISITALAASSTRPERFVGMHFFNPAHRMRLIEIVRARQSSPEAIATALEIAKRLGKIGIVVAEAGDGVRIAQHLRRHPVLTVAAVEVAAEHAEAVGERAGPGMEERLLLDRIALHAANVAVRHAEPPAVVEADLADADGTVWQRAAVSARGAAQPSVGERFDELTFVRLTREQLSQRGIGERTRWHGGSFLRGTSCTPTPIVRRHATFRLPVER